MQKRRAHNKKGFTLIEVLIVITIVAIAMSFVMPNFFGATERQNIQGFSEQLQNKIELARDKAIQQNQEWGLRIDRGEVSFLVFDYASQQWSKITENPFNSIYYENFAEIYLKVEDKKWSQNCILGKLGFQDFSKSLKTPKFFSPVLAISLKR